MNYHILTLFPEMVLDGLNTSIIGRAAGKGLLSIEAVNIRDYTKEKHGHVDDTPYGGGAGMVMQAAPVCDAYEALCERIGKRPRVLYMTPQGQTFNQKIAEELAQEEDLVFLCWITGRTSQRESKSTAESPKSWWKMSALRSVPVNVSAFSASPEVARA